MPSMLSPISDVFRRVYYFLKTKCLLLKAARRKPSKEEQAQLIEAYQRQFKKGGKRPTFADVGFSCHSQYEEDGILLFIFALIGTTNKKCVEICAEDGFECNTTNLLLHHGWRGLLCDGGAWNIYKAQQFFKAHTSTRTQSPTLVHRWITKDNVNAMMEEQGFVGEVDLLSIDLDGVDYWVWKELNVINPRVVVLEFNHLWGPETAVTIPYREDFVAEFNEWGSDYVGASLGAFMQLAREKGYTLIGTNAIATNAFFLRSDIESPWLPEVDPKTCFNHPRAQFGMKERFPKIKDKDWVYLS